jgi:hypothetical protein
VHPDVDLRVALQNLDQREIAFFVSLGEDVLKVANRLVIVKHER